MQRLFHELQERYDVIDNGVWRLRNMHNRTPDVYPLNVPHALSQLIIARGMPTTVEIEEHDDAVEINFHWDNDEYFSLVGWRNGAMHITPAGHHEFNTGYMQALEWATDVIMVTDDVPGMVSQERYDVQFYAQH